MKAEYKKGIATILNRGRLAQVNVALTARAALEGSLEHFDAADIRALAIGYQTRLAQSTMLLEALQRIMANDCPLTGNPTRKQLLEFWEYEKTQSRSEADDQIFALKALASAEGAEI